MEITIQINGQALSVEVSIEVYQYLDRADHKNENLAHEQRRHQDMRELDEHIIANECSRSYILTPEQIVCRKETLAEIMAVLNVCTETQRQERHSKLAGVRRIKTHALRHSHASLLISLGENALIVRDRLGHEDIETTLGTYGHLYPNTNRGVADRLTSLLTENNFERK